ncbi:hypothetical protein [Rhodanobacter sp. FW106-PBR-R2A-1-13]|uniref:hypothetical protein n=1 Tax=Rhodanobacter sp. FW106-PBR-R2A-1-13 TaxID=3454845 RepID=UPI0034E4A00C
MMPSTLRQDVVRPIHANHPGSDQAEPIQDFTTTASQLASLMEQMARANLSPSALRVGLDTFARMLRQGRTTEAVPTQWMAERLGIHRNAVGLAYASLQEIGLLRRIAVRERGAPTRTTAAGPALLFLSAMRQAMQGRERDPVGDPRESAIRPYAVLATPPRRERTPKAAGQSPASTSDFSADSPTPAAPQIEVQPDPLMAEPASEPSAVRPLAPAIQAESPPIRIFVFDATANASMAKKVGKDVLYRVMRHPAGQAFPIDPAWNLTDCETQHLQALLPKPEAPSVRASVAPVHKPSAPEDVARAAMQAIPRLAAAVGAERAGTIVDEIAFQVCIGGLGKGDHVGGVRAGVSMVLAKRWTTPRGFLPDWRGAVIRGAHSDAGAARETVH